MLATPFQECVLCLATFGHFGSLYNAQAMVSLSLETSTLIVSPISACIKISADRLKFFPGTRLELLGGQTWLPCEEDRAVRSLRRGHSDHREHLVIRM